MAILGSYPNQWQYCTRLSAQNRLPQALLFSGEVLATKHFAHTFAQWSFCAKPSAQAPCQHCQSCRWMQEGVHPEWVLIEALTSSISIDQIRELGPLLALKPQQAAKKWIIIVQVPIINFFIIY